MKARIKLSMKTKSAAKSNSQLCFLIQWYSLGLTSPVSSGCLGARKRGVQLLQEIVVIWRRIRHRPVYVIQKRQVLCRLPRFTFFSKASSSLTVRAINICALGKSAPLPLGEEGRVDPRLYNVFYYNQICYHCQTMYFIHLKICFKGPS